MGTEPVSFGDPCPRCGAQARQLARSWAAVPFVQCALCRAEYLLPGWGPMVVAVDRERRIVTFSKLGQWEPALAYRPRTLWRTLCDAWAGMVRGWRGSR